MGMAASQARFLGLTARQNNVEFEGQQINQQRTMLSNQSANYYNDLLGMTVPTPPSVDSYTKTVYTFNDGSLTNTLTSMLAQSNGTYIVSYLSKWQDDYTPVAAATSVVGRSGAAPDYTYSIGAAELRKLGDITYIPPQAGDTWNGKTLYADANGLYVKNNQCSQREIDSLEYYYFNPDMSQWATNPADPEGAYYIDANGDYQEVSIYGVDKDGSNYSYEDESGQTHNLNLSDVTMCFEDSTADDGLRFVEIDQDGDYVKELNPGQDERHYLTQQEIDAASKPDTTSFPQIAGKTDEEILGMMKEEAAWAKLLEQKYGYTDWLVRYVTDMTTKVEKPYFYSADQLAQADYDQNGMSLSAISCYTMGSEQKVEEFKGIEGCKLEKDSSGRYINLSIPRTDENGNTIYTNFALTTETSTDQDAYNDAMNQYEYDKYLYDQSVENINSKIEVIQAEDKNLELRLKQLDTEQKAINTEKEAVSKIIEKNTSDTFKTFSA
ncbi:hypothetical protein IKP85_02935 [bacterium]|nr:hypothetical protein [bacterium]